VWALLVLLLALLAAPSAPASSPPLEPIPGEHGYWVGGNPQADGRRYLVSNPEPGVIRVLDDVASASYDVRFASHCTPRGVTVNTALIACQGESDPRFLRLDTRALSSIDMPERGYNFEWFDIGRHWLAAWWTVNRPATFYLNRRTDLTVVIERFEEDPLDLSLARATRYDGNHTIWLRDGAHTLKDLRPTPLTQRLVLARRGGARTLLSRCRRFCGDYPPARGAALAGGLAAWTEGGHKVRVYDSRTGERFAWNVDEPGYGRLSVAGLTRRHIFVSVTEEREPGRKKLWRAPLPSAE
jgi:hypothetical protein